MICTVTVNPSLDYVVTVPNLQPGAVNRAGTEHIYPGGKGINVSILLNRLNVPGPAIGFRAGFTGAEMQRLLQETGCQTDFIPAEGLTRINVKIRAQQETEINGRGPVIRGEHIEALMDRLDKLQTGDWLVLAGSIPAGLPPDIYERILDRLSGRKIRTVVDASGDLLRNALKYRPFLIKPNRQELGELFGREAESETGLIRQAGALQQEGAVNVLVSLAKDGALLAAETGEVFRRPAPSGQLVNSVGSGDSMVAGFIAGYLLHQNYEEALDYGLAAGSASAFSPWLASAAEVQTILKRIRRHTPQVPAPDGPQSENPAAGQITERS